MKKLLAILLSLLLVFSLAACGGKTESDNNDGDNKKSSDKKDEDAADENGKDENAATENGKDENAATENGKDENDGNDDENDNGNAQADPGPGGDNILFHGVRFSIPSLLKKAEDDSADELEYATDDKLGHLQLRYSDFSDTGWEEGLKKMEDVPGLADSILPGIEITSSGKEDLTIDGHEAVRIYVTGGYSGLTVNVGYVFINMGEGVVMVISMSAGDAAASAIDAVVRSVSIG